jgi:hypothetical protein
MVVGDQACMLACAGTGRPDEGAGLAEPHADQAVFRSDAAAGRDAFAGLGVGVIVLALTMAAGCACGISRRLGEYQ